jgi:hypothetical protein
VQLRPASVLDPILARRSLALDVTSPISDPKVGPRAQPPPSFRGELPFLGVAPPPSQESTWFGIAGWPESTWFGIARFQGFTHNLVRDSRVRDSRNQPGSGLPGIAHGIAGLPESTWFGIARFQGFTHNLVGIHATWFGVANLVRGCQPGSGLPGVARGCPGIAPSRWDSLAASCPCYRLATPNVNFSDTL